VVKLRDRRQRDRDGLMIVEGPKELAVALERGLTLTSTYYCPDFFGDSEQALLERCKATGCPSLEVGPRAFEKMAYRARPAGILVLAEVPDLSLEGLAENLPESPFILVVEALEKPGNLGTIMRSADGAGVDGVIVCEGVTDIFNPNVIRSSLGTIFSSPIAHASTEEAIGWLRDRGVRLVAASPDATELFTEVGLSPPCAIAVGSEKDGLSGAWLNAADECVRIPMAGAADSLNAAQAATLMMYEVVRQTGPRAKASDYRQFSMIAVPCSWMIRINSL